MITNTELIKVYYGLWKYFPYDVYWTKHRKNYSCF